MEIPDCDLLLELWEKDRNPLLLWEIVRLWHLGRCELPQVCREYLFETACHLLNDMERIDGRKIDSHLKQALGINFHHYRPFRKARLEYDIRGYIDAVISLNGCSVQEAAEMYADFPGVSLTVETIVNYYYKSKRDSEQPL